MLRPLEKGNSPNYLLETTGQVCSTEYGFKRDISFVQEQKMPWFPGGITLEKQIWKILTALYSNPEVIT